MRSEIGIDGMTCGACTAAVTAALLNVEGVREANVALPTETAIVDHVCSPADLVQVIEDTGFDVREIQTLDVDGSRGGSATVASRPSVLHLCIFGMTCAACAALIENALKNLEGVVEANVTIATDRAVVQFDSRVVGARDLIRCVEDAGFDAAIDPGINSSEQIKSLERVKETIEYRNSALWCLILSIPIFALSKFRRFMPRWITFKLFDGLYFDDIISLILVLPIQFYIGRRFYVKSWKALKANAPNMDVLVTISTSCAMFYSLGAMIYGMAIHLKGHQMYLFESCSMIILFVLLGKYLENKARGETSAALSALIALVPERAVLLQDGREQELASELLHIGDAILIKPGATVPADGIVEEGRTFIDESTLTGENMSVPKQKGDMVYGGTINGKGSLTVRVTQVGSETKLSQIVQLVKEALAARAPIQRYADYVASRFVPSILILAGVTFAAWLLVSHCAAHPPPIFESTEYKFVVCLRMAISVIVIACPCALGLAMPTAVMVATGVGAKYGILVKGGPVFELLSHVNTVIFDKTGTLTTGAMKVVRCTIPEEHLELLEFVESKSEHAIGQVLCEYVRAVPSVKRCQTLQLVEFEALSGKGVSSVVSVDEKMHRVTVGTAETVFDETGTRPSMPSAELESCTTVYMCVDGIYVGDISLQDELRPEAVKVVTYLQATGYDVGIISGDSASVVASVARRLHVDESFAWSGIYPDGKVEVIQDLQNGAVKRSVAMVGDGINDSPALVAASVGISIQGATQVAVDSADVVLVRQEPLEQVVGALDLGRHALRRIKINLLASVLYNVCMIPFAMGVLLPFGIMINPMMASAAMAASSVSVVVSSLWLKRWKPPILDDWRPKSRVSRFLDATRSLFRRKPQHEYIMLDAR